MWYQHCWWQRQVVDVRPMQHGNRVCQNPQLAESVVGMNWPVVAIQDDDCHRSVTSRLVGDLISKWPITCQAGHYTLCSYPLGDQSDIHAFPLATPCSEQSACLRLFELHNYDHLSMKAEDILIPIEFRWTMNRLSSLYHHYRLWTAYNCNCKLPVQRFCDTVAQISTL